MTIYQRGVYLKPIEAKYEERRDTYKSHAHLRLLKRKHHNHKKSFELRNCANVSLSLCLLEPFTLPRQARPENKEH